MVFGPKVFKAYDIRGIVPDELDADAAEQVGRAFAAYLKPQAVVVGHDVRSTGPEFQRRVIEGLIRSGVDVIDIGLVSTDAFYYACAVKELPGIMVTASHNPAAYNGFKMVKKIPELVKTNEFKTYVLEGQYQDAAQSGQVQKEDVIEPFLDHLLKVVPPVNLGRLKVVVDTSSGAQGPIWQRLMGRLPVEVDPLFFERDGTFPGHGNDVIQPENQGPLRRRVLETQADMGLIFDPDGDRCLLVDDRGITVPGDFITALLAASMLKREPGSTIVYDIRASDIVPDTVTQAGGRPQVSRVGHTNIKPVMQQNQAIFGGEVSGHYYFKDFFYVDCGLLAGLTLIEYVSQLDVKLSEKVLELESLYHLSGEINSKVDDVSAVLARIKQEYSDAKVNELDGVEVRYPNWRFVVRASNTEPLIRLTLEAASQEEMIAKRDEVLTIIRQ